MIYQDFYKKNNLKKIFTFLIFFTLFHFYTFDNIASNTIYPATPSSSYNTQYFKSNKQPKNANDTTMQRNNLFNNTVNLGEEIIVNGNFRLDSEVIIRDSKIDNFDEKTKKVFNIAIKNLYETGYFSSVKIVKKNDKIIIDVKENPIINKIAFEGNSELDDDELISEVSSKVKNVFSINKVKADIISIQNMYKRLGFFSTYIEPKKINIGQNRINLVFEINEGLEAKIKKINFVGNKEFSDNTLSNVIFSEESRWYKFWSSGDKFDQDRIEYDKDLLKKYYYDNGFIDFRVISANSQLVLEKKNFVINFKLYEGKRYKVGGVKFETSDKDLSKIDINKILNIEKNDWFSSANVEKDIENITKKASELGLAFVDVRPRIRKEKNNIVFLTYQTFETEKIFIDRINITGNSKTHDKVIRREIELVEGDAFNLSKINRSETNLNKLGLFSGVKLDYKPIPKSNKTVINLEVQEAATGEFSVGAGYSSLDGALGNVGVKESNLFGEGKELALTLGLSTRKSNIDLRYTEPYFLDKDLAAGFDLFNIRQNQKIYSGYKQNQIGFKLRAGYEIIDDLRHFSSYTLRRDKIHDIDPATSVYIKSQEGKFVTSMIGQAFQYDKLNDRINPTDGYRVRLDVDYFGLGGDSSHIATEIKTAKFTKLFKGSYLANFLELGHIETIDKKIRINHRFFLGGDSLRGFKNAGVGPRDISTTDALGGEQYIVSRNEFNFPIGLPDELGVNGIIFGDFGTSFKASETGSTVEDDLKFRSSAGVGIAWVSPFGPIRVFLSKALMKESFDKVETFRFTFGTTY